MSWTFIYLMVFLKLPIAAMLYLVWWAIHQEPEEIASPGEDGGSKRLPHHPRPRLPRNPRRGPHGGQTPASPARTRTAVTRVRQVHS